MEPASAGAHNYHLYGYLMEPTSAGAHDYDLYRDLMEPISADTYASRLNESDGRFNFRPSEAGSIFAHK